MKIINKKQDFG